MALHVTEIVAGILILARTETLLGSQTCQSRETRSNSTCLEILVLPLVRVWRILEPHLVLGNGVEVDDLLAFPHLISC